MFDSLFVLDEQLNTWDVDVEPGALWRPFNWSVYAAIVLAAHIKEKYNQNGNFSIKQYVKYDLCSGCKRYDRAPT